MILKTYLKKNNYVLSDREQSILGKNICRCFFSLHPNTEIKKVSIRSNEIKMEVLDYPRFFFESEHLKKVVKRFMNKKQYLNEKRRILSMDRS